ncbi:MAG: ECF transporter S component [Clostridia bacterium]|nr:ECF transporter S component [Clostridia bacterium]
MKKLVYSAMCLALCLVLPFLTGQIPEIGSMLLPMHIPVLLCGFLCGGGWGAAVGFTAPLLRHLLFGMPPMPGCISMAFELATYGLVVGLLHKKMGKSMKGVYVSLICAMVAGRLVWGVAQMAIMGLNGGSFPFSAFVAGAFTSAIPGIVLQLVLIPVLVRALDKAGVKA